MFFLFLHRIGPWYVLFFPLVLDSTCFLLSFAVSQRNIGMFFRNVSTANLMGTQPSPRWNPGKSELPGSLQRFGEDITPLAGVVEKVGCRWNNQMGWESQMTHFEDLGRRIWEFFLHQDDTPSYFLDPEIIPKQPLYTSQFLGCVGSILSWILPSFFCVLDFDSWSKDPVLWQVILKVWVMNRASKGWCIYYISLKL